MSKIIKLNPFIVRKVWGGDKLHSQTELSSIENVGELWEVSTLSEGTSTIGTVPLSDICQLNYLVKFIDTSDNLSIQVHPTDEFANAFENSSGKTECWIILDSEAEAGIYLGFKPGVTRKEFFTAIENGLSIESFLNFIPVSPGQFIFVPAGSIHAIGKGVTLCEVQQSCGLTYRVWDWDRMGLNGKARELHLEKAKEVLNFSADFNDTLINKIYNAFTDNLGVLDLCEHQDFKVQLFTCHQDKEYELNVIEKTSLVCLDGSISGDIDLNKLQTGFVLEAGSIKFKASKKTSFLIVC